MEEKELNFNIEFNELLIRDNKLIIDVSIKNSSECTNIYLDTIKVDNMDSFGTGYPIYINTLQEDYDKLYTLPDNCNNIKTDVDYKDCKVSNFGKKKHVRLELSSQKLSNSDVNSDMFFIYIDTKKETTPGEYISMQESTVGIAFNKSLLFNMSMPYIKELNCKCEVPRNFIDYILNVKALELCLKAGNYIKAMDVWKWLVNKNKKCNCDGTLS